MADNFDNEPLIARQHFRSAAALKPSDDAPPITFAIRTDAGHAAELLIKSLVEHGAGNIDPEKAAKTVKKAYAAWGQATLTAFSDYIDYKAYGLDQARGIEVDFYDSKSLERKVTLHGTELGKKAISRGIMPMSISLDDMIAPGETFSGEIAFSRLFNLQGEEQDYVGRPGKLPLDEQLAALHDKVRDVYNKFHGAMGISDEPSDTFSAKIIDFLNSADDGTSPRFVNNEIEESKIPIILLEDNVRRAKMLNWIIDRMDRAGILKYARIEGIATCFCNASPEELSQIQHKGRVIPVSAVVDYSRMRPVDVTTTRDLMFDGFVISAGNNLGRLPGIFMDVVKRFKIDPAKADYFRRDVAVANREFCNTIEKSFGVSPVLSWFDSGTAVAHVTGSSLDRPMSHVMDDFIDQLPVPPKPERKVVPFKPQLKPRAA